MRHGQGRELRPTAAYHTPGRSGKAAGRAGAADRTAAMGRVEIRAAGRRQLAEAAVPGARSALQCQHHQSADLGRLSDRARHRAGRARGRHQLYPDRGGSVRLLPISTIAAAPAPTASPRTGPPTCSSRPQSYREITPSGEGFRIWGLADGSKLVKQIHIAGGGALEIYRRCHKALTITGLEFAPAQSLENIDRVLERAAKWAEQHKAKPEPAKAAASDSTAPGCSGPTASSDIERIVAEGAPAGANRSDMFHAIVGHLPRLRRDRGADRRALPPAPGWHRQSLHRRGRLIGEVQRSLRKVPAPRPHPSDQWSLGRLAAAGG